MANDLRIGHGRKSWEQAEAEAEAVAEAEAEAGEQSLAARRMMLSRRGKLSSLGAIQPGNANLASRTSLPQRAEDKRSFSCKM